MSDEELTMKRNTYNTTDREEWIPFTEEEETEHKQRKRRKPKQIKQPKQYMRIHDTSDPPLMCYTNAALKKHLVFYQHVTKRKNEEIKRLERKLQKEKEANEKLKLELIEAQKLAPQLE